MEASSQGLTTAHTCRLAVLVEDPAAIVIATRVIVAPFAAELLVDRESLGIAEVDIASWADVGRHGDTPRARS